MFSALKNRLLDRLAVAVAHRLADRLVLAPNDPTDRLVTPAAGQLAEQRALLVRLDDIERKLHEQTAIESIDDALWAERLAPMLAQRLATTPVLFGGDWSRVEIGENVHLVNTLLNVSSGRISIGEQTFFGHNVSLITGTHDVASVMADRHDYPRNGRDIVIGKGVWIASNAIVLGPCTIGDHAVIAAGAVVTGGQIESGCLYAGVPAKRIRKLIGEEIAHDRR
ncbi:acyltransferase [Burkholderia multivorans]|uniref:acyltransferase n=1 Tax=Burkholderia multivorans TaxID=87883 RepID=UPI00069E4D36|nr:acyltransferase [Burkholderia multivorans]MDN7399966.1 acyltransferase [Burkholderia multivorans]MDN7405521.1 acyltransferase [Burkholderia multivorans]MDN7417716.1 acyltransferase [Burkholderia multivorans]MDN7434509.1 acyltransferase [Burkholderia multivorans]MDN7477878.1 acyltransferase [Burkholderia multivorans]